jgi:uncharacterized protein (TIGR03437 family)
LLAAAPGFGYVRTSTSGGTPVSRPTATPVKFRTDGSARAGLRNGEGKLTITPGSDVAAALQAAIETWNAVSGAVKLAPLELGDGPQQSGENVITFEDTPENRSIAGDSLAVTRTLFNARTGEIGQARIVFNPGRTFSTRLALDAFDIQSVATHEIGHALGAGHSHVRSATMYPSIGDENPVPRTLSPDDVAFLLDAYPTDESRARMGSVRGRMSCGGDACSGRASLTLIEPASGVILGVVAAASGNYAVNAVPPGEYLVHAAPYRGDAPGGDEPVPEWQPTFRGAGNIPVPVTVQPSAATEADIAGTPGSPPFRLEFVVCEAMTWFEVLASGRTWACQLTGAGFGPEVSANDVLVFGPGVAVRPDSVRFRRRGEATDLLFTLDTADRERRSYAAIGLQQNGAVAVLPELTILPRRPMLAPSDVVNAASVLPAPVAPGELVALFGSGIGPVESVRFDDLSAPVLSSAESLLIVQVPFEVAGRDQTVLRLRSRGVDADEIQLDVVSVSPGLLRTVTNSNGRANSSSNPALRGTTIEVRGTGQGLLDPPLATGDRTPAGVPFPVREVAATLDGMPAPVQTAEMIPGQIGIFRIVIEIPADAPAGDAVTLKVAMRGSERTGEAAVAIR